MIVFSKRKAMESLKNKDLTGMKFGKWTVIGKGNVYYWNGKINSYKWECKCECGNIQHIPSGRLRAGRTIGCKPCFKARQKDRRYYTIYERLFYQRVTNNLNNRTNRGLRISVSIDAQQYYEIAKNNCHYCNAEPVEYSPYKEKESERDVIYVNGVDRMDNTKGYEIGNCVPCCYSCNSMKMDMTVNDFKNKINKLYEFFIKKDKK